MIGTRWILSPLIETNVKLTKRTVAVRHWKTCGEVSDSAASERYGKYGDLVLSDI